MKRVFAALDVDAAAAALAIADSLRGVVAGFKIGKQLFTAEGPGVVRALAARGDRVFVDLKFHDIPNTVAAAIAAAARTGAWMINVHASGGRRMMEAAARAADDVAASRGGDRPRVIAVTVLTSLDSVQLAEAGVDRPLADHVVHLARLAQASGLDGVVASPQEIAAIRAACGESFLIVTPGIRPSQGGPPGDDQARTMTAAAAVHAGATYLVVGRPITGAPDPRTAALELEREIAGSGDPALSPS